MSSDTCCGPRPGEERGGEGLLLASKRSTLDLQVRVETGRGLLLASLLLLLLLLLGAGLALMVTEVLSFFCAGAATAFFFLLFFFGAGSSLSVGL